MSDDQTRLTQAYKRASLGLALAALLWTAAFLFGGLPNEEKTHWLIKIKTIARLRRHLQSH